MTERLFGTDGIRGKAGYAPLTPPLIKAIGVAIGGVLGGRIVVGSDTRLSCPWIRACLSEGLKEKAEVEQAGILPTPAIALITSRGDFSGGVVISASHNPYSDNGIKVFSSSGRKLSDEEETRIEAWVHQIGSKECEAKSIAVEPAASWTDSTDNPIWINRYWDLLLERFPPGHWLIGRRLLVDCANGAMSAVAPGFLRKLGAVVEVINATPNGRNINDLCGAVFPNTLASAITRGSFDLGVSFDGDGDRVLFASPEGRVLDGDAILMVLSQSLAGSGKLVPASVVGTSMTNYALERILAASGIRLYRTNVGDRYIVEEMRRTRSALGGEPSGHLVFGETGLSGDGLVTVLKVLQVMVESGRSISSLTANWSPMPQLLDKVEVRTRTPIDAMPVLSDAIRMATLELDGRGRLVVRYSGTEPVLRILVESDSGALNDRIMARLKDSIRREPGVV